MTRSRAGHSVLAIPVPAVERYVRARTEHHDASFLSTDPRFAHAHLTLLAPWLPEPGPHDLDAVRGIVANAAAFDYRLTEVRSFPDGVLYLHPEPAEPFAALAAELAAAFPRTPPYGGAFPDSVPHVTLERVAADVDVASVTRDLAATGALLPVRARAERVDLQWWANDDCRVLASWQLG